MRAMDRNTRCRLPENVFSGVSQHRMRANCYVHMHDPITLFFYGDLVRKIFRISQIKNEDTRRRRAGVPAPPPPHSSSIVTRRSTRSPTVDSNSFLAR